MTPGRLEEGVEVLSPALTDMAATMEVIRIVVRLSGAQTPPGVAHFWIFDLDNLGAHPGESLRARRPGFELGEIDDFHTLQEGQVSKVGGHEAR